MFQVAGSDNFQTGAFSRTGSAIGRALRLVAALVLAIPGVATVADAPVSATGLAFVPKTAFEIDGNLAVDGNLGVPNVSIAGDWGVSAGTPANSWTGGTYDPGATPAPGSFASTGSYYMYRNMDLCDSDQDTIGVGGDKVEFGPIWPVNIGNVLNKGDVKSVSLAAEKVNVGGQINDIVYAAFELCQDAGGSFNASLYFDDGDGIPPSAGDNGDYLILFDFKSAQVGEGSLFRRILGTWVFQSNDGTKIDTFATGLVGEAAVNLTTLGILPGVTDPVNNPTACRTLEVGGQAATISGYSTGSQLKDIVDVTPLDLSNCGPLKVKKLSNATDTTTEFGYDVFQADSQQVHDSTLGVSGGAVTAEPSDPTNEIDATINVGETHTWTNVISQPDYKITEDAPPLGWALVSISCTYPNIFAAPVGGVYPIATSVIFTANAYTAATFLVPPSFIDLGGVSPLTLPAAECTMTNNVTGIKIVKTGAGDPLTLFPFADNSAIPKTASLTIVDNPATTGVVENAATFLYGPGVNVTVTETIPLTTPAWALVGVSCVRPNGVVVATSSTPSVSVTTVAGEVITCTYTNNQKAHLTLVKSVTNNSGGTAVATDFTLSAAGTTPISGAGGVSSDVEAGSYELSETAVAGYTGGAWSCVGGTQTGATVALAMGQSATCTIINDDQAANLTLVKTVTNNNGGTALATDFTLSAAGPTSISGAGGVSSGVSAGTYTLSETGLAGYAAGSWSCSKNAGDPVIGSSISLGLGDSATCSIVNNDIAPVLRLRKLVTNDNGGTATVANFTLTADGAGSNDVSGTSPVDSGAGLLADTWALSESTVAGYAASAWSCVGGTQSGANITVGIGGTATCTITNNDIAPILHLRKIVTNDNGGTATVADFTLTANGAGANDVSGISPVDSGGTLQADTWALSENTVAGYSASTWACVGGIQSGASITVGIGGEATCTITNNDIAPILHLRKVVTNNNGGTATVADFTLTADGAVVGNDLSGTSPVDSGAGLKADTWALSETNPGGYTASVWNCVGGTQNGASITVGIGGEATCTITNDDQTAHLTLVKTVTNDGGGTAVATDFTLSASGPTLISGAGGVSADVNAGTYTLSETSIPGYSAGAWSCVGGTQTGASVALALGQSATCTIINDDQSANLTLVKSVVNNNGGTAVAADFTLSAAGPTPISGAGGVSSGVNAGTYTLSETSLAGYAPGLWSCSKNAGDPVIGGSISLALGDSATCSIINNDIAPVLRLRKVVTNNNGGTATVADFTLTADGVGANDLSGTSPVDSGGTLQADTWALSETNPGGYSASAWTCVGGTQSGASITVGIGGAATCTITNDDIAPTITVIKSVVNDDGGTAVVGDFDLFLSTVDVATPVTSGIANPAFAKTAYTISEGSFAGYAPTGVACVSNLERDDSALGTGTITVTPELAENIVCTITNSDVRPGLTVVKNVINDNGGNAVVSDFVLKVGDTTVASGATNTYPANTDLVISEVQVAGYTATGTVCLSSIESGSNNITNVVAGATVRLLPGETVVCTITNNDKPIDLEIIKSDGGANPILGGAFNYTLTITNLGTRDPDAGEPIVVTDLLPAGLLYSTPLPAGCVAAGQTLTCTLAAADLGPGESVVLTIPVTVSLSATAGTVTNKAWVTTDDDPVCVECTPPPPCPAAFAAGALVSNPSNNVDCEDTPIQEVADLAIVKTVSDATPTLGQSFDWILTVTNNGPNVAKDVTINDLVPGSVVVTAVASSDFVCIQVGNGVSCTRATLAVGATGTIRITVLLPVTTPVETTIINVAEVTGSVFDPDLTNNTSRATAIPEAPVVLPPTTPPLVIPETGSDAASGLLLGLAMVLFGGFASIIARRRSRHAGTNA